jgi:hypothetical protein
LKPPTPEQVESVALLLTHGEQHRHFFDRLQNPEWLTPLKDKGYFSSPPPPIPDETGPYFSLPVWPESRYLARMARLEPEKVAEILRLIPTTENARVHDDFLQAILAMPASLSATFVPNVIKWINGRFQVLSPEKFGALLGHLASAGEIDTALQLARALLELRPDPRKSEKTTEENRFLFPEPQPIVRSWNYGRILDGEIPKLVAVAPVLTLALLCDLLDDAMRLSQRDDNEQEPDDYSNIWRPALEQPRHTVDNVRGMLVSATRAAAEQTAKQAPASVPEITFHLESRKWRIFHRIALHILRLFPNEAADLIEARLTDPERFENSHYRREYTLLAKECFARLQATGQAKILEWIEKGPNIELFRAGWQTWYRDPPTEEQTTGYIKRWQRDRLAPLSAGRPEDWNVRYRDLVTEFGPVEEPTTSIEPTWGWSTPKTKEELGALSIEQLIEYLRSWVASGSGSPLDASVQGLAQAFGALVVSQPERLSAEAERFVGLDPTYVRAVLQGLWESAQQKRSLDWKSVLALCAWVVQQPRSIPGRQGRITEQDPDWGWTRKTISSLLYRGFNSDAIPFQNRSQCWQILEILTDDPDPTPQDELRYNADRDSANYSINTVRGEALHAVIGYALWVYRATKKETDAGDHSMRSFGQMSEVRAVLDKHLDPNIDSSAAIRSVYGQWFPWLVFLDPNWAGARAPRIFPSELEFEALRDAAWDTYITYCTPSDEAFEILQEQYRRAIDRIEPPADPAASRNAPDSCLAQHLMNLYWRGKLAEDDPNGLIARFYQKADPKLRHWALEFIGRSLHNTKEPVDSEVIQRLQRLWARRLQALRPAESSALEKEELKAFSWWFASSKFPDAWSIEQLDEVLRLCGSVEPDHLVVERLAELAASFPAKAVECLALIVGGDKSGWGVHAWLEPARKLLAQVINSVDQPARVRAIALVHHLGERGYSQFRDLLQ